MFPTTVKFIILSRGDTNNALSLSSATPANDRDFHEKLSYIKENLRKSKFSDVNQIFNVSLMI